MAPRLGPTLSAIGSVLVLVGIVTDDDRVLVVALGALAVAGVLLAAGLALSRRCGGQR